MAVYGKGGIGKSTMSSNITAALSDMGLRVLQIGCDPKHDSTRLLLGGKVKNTILDYLKAVRPADRKLEGIIAKGYRGCLCAEAGGPEPGVGCAGRGIISSFQLLNELGIDRVEHDITLYDVLGDVVCGGFAVPLRNEYADIVFIVSSGEFMSIYAANNILKGINNYNPDRVGGIIFNSRGDPEENERIRRFSDAVHIPIIASFGRSELFMSAEDRGQTVVEAYPDSEIAKEFASLARKIVEFRKFTAEPLSEEELERCVLGRDVHKHDSERPVLHMAVKDHPKKRYVSRNVLNEEPYGGCAFSGAHNTCSSIDGLTTILHSPLSCAQFAFQTVPGTQNRYSGFHVRTERFADPCVRCTGMNESDLIFGGLEKLNEEIESAANDGCRDIAVITSCPSGIIGDDVGSVAEKAESSFPGIRIAVINTDGNMNGDFVQGVIDATIALCRRFSQKCDKTESVNLIGTKPMALSTMNSVSLCTEILNAIGIEVNCILPGCGSVGSISRLGAAKMDLMLSPDIFAIQISTFLEEEYGIPVCPVPVRPGLAGTEAWIRFIAEKFGRTKEAESLISSLEEEYSRMIAPYRNVLKGKRCVILSVTKDIDWILEAVKETEMECVRAVAVDRSDYCNDVCVENYFPKIILTDTIDVDAERNIIEEMTPDVIISTVPIGVNQIQISIPLVSVAGPFSGISFMKRIAERMSAPSEEGWREDVVRS